MNKSIHRTTNDCELQNMREQRSKKKFAFDTRTYNITETAQSIGNLTGRRIQRQQIMTACSYFMNSGLNSKAKQSCAEKGRGSVAGSIRAKSTAYSRPSLATWP